MQPTRACTLRSPLTSPRSSARTRMSDARPTPTRGRRRRHPPRRPRRPRRCARSSWTSARITTHQSSRGHSGSTTRRCGALAPSRPPAAPTLAASVSFPTLLSPPA
eukprot:2621567-Prymnesium_polylepis.1